MVSAIHVLRPGLGNVRAVSASAIFGRLQTSSEVFGRLWESSDVFLALPG